MASFIVMEGIDGAGTTTQTQRLLDRMRAQGAPALATREPSDGPIGVMIRQMLAMRIAIARPGQPHAPMTRETLAALFAADRLDHLAAEIVPALERGVHVICDRYVPSSLAYQGDVEASEAGAQERVDYAWVDALNSRARAPSLTFAFEIDVEVALARLDQRHSRDLYETRDKLARLTRRYREVFELLEARGWPVVRLDATLPVDTLHDIIWGQLIARDLL